MVNNITEHTIIANERGYTLIELMVALGIFVIGYLAITSMYLTSINAHEKAMRMTDASYYMSSEIDRLLSIDYTTFTDGADQVSTEQFASGRSHQLSRYTSTYSVDEVTPPNGIQDNYRVINLTISWEDTSRETKSITTSIIRLNNKI